MPRSSQDPDCMKLQRKKRRNKIGIHPSFVSSINNESDYNERKYDNMVLERKLSNNKRFNQNKVRSQHAICELNEPIRFKKSIIY